MCIYIYNIITLFTCTYIHTEWPSNTKRVMRTCHFQTSSRWIRSIDSDSAQPRKGTWSATLWMPSSDWWVTCSWCKCQNEQSWESWFLERISEWESCSFKRFLESKNSSQVLKQDLTHTCSNLKRVADGLRWSLFLPLLGEWLLECLHGQFWDCPGWSNFVSKSQNDQNVRASI